MSTPLQLSDLIGQHLLRGVDVNDTDDKLATHIAFTLDKKTYLAVCDPSDDYRSYLDYIKEIDGPTNNTFRGVRVIARMSDGHDDDVLQLIHAKTGKLILSVGTEDKSDYYPSWVAAFEPSNL